MIRTDRYKIVINHEEQYNIVSVDEVIKGTWREVGKTGTKEQCLNYIEEVWTDMKPDQYKKLLSSLGIRRP